MSNLSTTAVRLISAGILLPFFFFCVFSNILYNLPLFFLVSIFSFFGVREFVFMQKHKYNIILKNTDNKAGLESGGIPFIYISLAASFALNLYFYIFFLNTNYPAIFPLWLSNFKLDFNILCLFLFLIIFASFLGQIFLRPLKEAMNCVSLTLFPVLYIALPLSLVLILKINLETGPQIILFAAASSFLADAGAYFFGIYLGKHKTNFRVSPNKSWEGYIGGVIINILGIMFISFLFNFFKNSSVFGYLESALLGAVLGITGQIGDLAESAIKRDSGVKDSGQSIPGHGGVLDLIDSALVNVPMLFFYIHFFKKI